MLEIRTDEKAGCLELIVDGPISRKEYQAAVDAVDLLLKTRKHINVVEIVRSVGVVAPDVWWKDLVFHLTHHNFLHRVAVVSDQGWVGPVTRFFAPLFPAEIRTFPEADLERARTWAVEKGVDPTMVKPHLDFA